MASTRSPTTPSFGGSAHGSGKIAILQWWGVRCGCATPKAADGSNGQMWPALASSDGRSKADGVSGLRTGTGRSARPERAWIRHGRGSPSRSTAAGKLGMLELEQEAAARLLDAAVLFGKPEAAASLAAHCAEVPRTLRVWLREDLVSFDGSWPLGELSLKCPNVVAAHGFSQAIFTYAEFYSGIRRVLFGHVQSAVFHAPPCFTHHRTALFCGASSGAGRVGLPASRKARPRQKTETRHASVRHCAVDSSGPPSPSGAASRAIAWKHSDLLPVLLAQPAVTQPLRPTVEPHLLCSILVSKSDAYDIHCRRLLGLR